MQSKHRLFLGTLWLASCTATPQEPAPLPSVTVSPSSSVAENPSALPVATSGTTVTGTVHDDAGQSVDEVTVTATNLDGSQVQTATTTGGQYTLTNCPVGVTLKVAAHKTGWTTRSQTLVTASGANQLDFTSEAARLSDLPEIVRVTPPYAAKGVAQDTPLLLVFSEPVKTSSVEDHVRIGLAADEDLVLSTGDQVESRYRESEDEGTNEALQSASDFYDEDHLDFAWNSDRTSVTITLKPGYLWISDKDAGKVPTWAVYFEDAIQDDDGQERSDQLFRLVESQTGRFGTTFKPSRDQTAPKVVSIRAVNATDGHGDRLFVKFSETLVVEPDSGAVDNTTIPGKSRAGHVLRTETATRITAFDYGVGAGASPATDFVLDAAADGVSENTISFDPDDETQSTVVLEFDADTFAVTDRVVVQAAVTVTDPAGNGLSSDKNLAESEAI